MSDANNHQLAQRIAELERLSVTKIMLAVVPGEDGIGEEVYATSIEDVENELSKMGLKLEDCESQTLALRRKVAAAPQAAPMPDERQFILQVLLCVLQNDVEALQVMHHERSEELSVAYAALSAAPVSEQPQEASTAQPDSEREEIASALAFVADTIERFDDKTMEGNYMLDASECAGIVRAMQTFPFRATITAPQDAQERDATKLRRPLCGGAGNVGEEPEL
jgi:hypothetical protein